MRPSLPFYPDDWMNDLGLRGCSPAARGVWMDLICMMHQGQPYGYLEDVTGPLAMKFIARRVGVTPKQLAVTMAELEDHQVFSRSEQGTVYSRRMVRDEFNRKVRALGGPKSSQNASVPPRKGILPPRSEGILPHPPPKDTFGPEEVKEEVKKSKNNYEETNCAWKWYLQEYPTAVNEFMDLQLFLSVMETPADLAALYCNLPLWKQTKRWKDGFWIESKRFLGEKIFKICPKTEQFETTKRTNLQRLIGGE